MPIPPKPLPVHVTEPVLVAQHALICGEYFLAWGADLKRRLKASEGAGGIQPSRHLQLCAGVADELRKACQRVERVLRGGVDAMNTSTLDATKNVVEDVLRYMYRVSDDDPRKPTECCVCDAAPLDGINVCSKHAALARQTMFYLLGAANEAMGYTEDTTPGKRMRCDFPEGCERHAVAMIDDDAAGRRFVRCGEHSLELLGAIAVAAATAPAPRVDFNEPKECADCREPITTEPPWRAESDWWHRACHENHRAAKDKVVALRPNDPAHDVKLCPRCGFRVLPVAPQTEVDGADADAHSIAAGVYHLGCREEAILAAVALEDGDPQPTADQAPPQPYRGWPDLLPPT